MVTYSAESCVPSIVKWRATYNLICNSRRVEMIYWQVHSDGRPRKSRGSWPLEAVVFVVRRAHVRATVALFRSFPLFSLFSRQRAAAAAATDPLN